MLDLVGSSSGVLGDVAHWQVRLANHKSDEPVSMLRLRFGHLAEALSEMVDNNTLDLRSADADWNKVLYIGILMLFGGGVLKRCRAALDI